MMHAHSLELDARPFAHVARAQPDRHLGRLRRRNRLLHARQQTKARTIRARHFVFERDQILREPSVDRLLRGRDANRLEPHASDRTIGHAVEAK